MSETLNIPYSTAELRQAAGPRIYSGRQLDEIAFPLGGIGTGTVSLGGWGQLRDFEIFNRPAKGLQFQYSFFTLRACAEGQDAVTRVLQGPVGGTFTGTGSGVDRGNGAGLPHFRDCRFVGTYPIGRVELSDPKVPLDVSIEAFNPFIPLNDQDSSLPCAIFLFHLRNPGAAPVRGSLFANLENRLGHPEVGRGTIAFCEGEASGLVMGTEKHACDSARFGTLALMTPWKDLNVQTCWFRGAWFDSLHRFWDQAAHEGELEENRETVTAEDGRTDVGSLGLRFSIGPGETATLPVVLAWHNPNFEKYWDKDRPTWKNFYATLFPDAASVAKYAVRDLPRLESETRRFQDALLSSTLPAPVLDAVASQISILKSTTCLRLTDGTFYGWEGCSPNGGCCEGTCTHVWNYAQALPWLFPALERSIRDADYRFNVAGSGHMTFRMPLPLGVMADAGFHAAADGQMGGVMKVYREWQIGGDDQWLRAVWPKVRSALEYAWQAWDADRDGVMEGVQHNTYDIEFYGPNTMMGSFYLGALRAGEEMARHLGEPERADAYRQVFESGRFKMDAQLFNGEYYRQDVRPEAGRKAAPGSNAGMSGQAPDPTAGYPRYQFGDGCLSDQMIGQWMARILGLGDLFDPQKVKSALRSVFRYNWRPDLSEHANPQRIYALNREAGLLLCSWPKGGRPALPFPYSDEVWYGIEYQVASHLIYEELLDEGLAIVKGARDRNDGTRRNPWNEFECGNHYARSMASYALMLALSGYSWSAPAQRLAFAPRLSQERFACFFSTATGWGTYRQQASNGGTVVEIELLWGDLTLRRLGLERVPLSPRAGVNGRQIATGVAAKDITFDPPVAVRAGETLRVEVGG